MGRFEWRDAYRTGYEVLDLQHQQLFQAIQELHDAFKLGRGPVEIARLLEFLAEYVHQHFSEEETCMAQLGFPELSSHRLEHRMLACRVEELRRRRFLDDPALGMGASQLMFQWLRDHILVLDMAFAEFARRRP